ncbi:hypothetical protein B0H16DRAFT_1730232 [Mycena metata]|uniref:Uncharacterized protein n=1 Tax=Mycena metata TaxID=1033252 RepID=A0AAD7I900_9AGAR|nr:hypothetical protein B0H16DRAFT_1730232 [Mycena metata]
MPSSTLRPSLQVSYSGGSAHYAEEHEFWLYSPSAPGLLPCLRESLNMNSALAQNPDSTPAVTDDFERDHETRGGICVCAFVGCHLTPSCPACPSAIQQLTSKDDVPDEDEECYATYASSFFTLAPRTPPAYIAPISTRTRRCESVIIPARSASPPPAALVPVRLRRVPRTPRARPSRVIPRLQTFPQTRVVLYAHDQTHCTRAPPPAHRLILVLGVAHPPPGPTLVVPPRPLHLESFLFAFSFARTALRLVVFILLAHPLIAFPRIRTRTRPSPTSPALPLPCCFAAAAGGAYGSAPECCGEEVNVDLGTDVGADVGEDGGRTPLPTSNHAGPPLPPTATITASASTSSVSPAPSITPQVFHTREPALNYPRGLHLTTHHFILVVRVAVAHAHAHAHPPPEPALNYPRALHLATHHFILVVRVAVAHAHAHPPPKPALVVPPRPLLRVLLGGLLLFSRIGIRTNTRPRLPPSCTRVSTITLPLRLLILVHSLGTLPRTRARVPAVGVTISHPQLLPPHLARVPLPIAPDEGNIDLGVDMDEDEEGAGANKGEGKREGEGEGAGEGEENSEGEDEDARACHRGRTDAGVERADGDGFVDFAAYAPLLRTFTPSPACGVRFRDAWPCRR